MFVCEYMGVELESGGGFGVPREIINNMLNTLTMLTILVTPSESGSLFIPILTSSRIPHPIIAPSARNYTHFKCMCGGYTYEYFQSVCKVVL